MIDRYEVKSTKEGYFYNKHDDGEWVKWEDVEFLNEKLTLIYDLCFDYDGFNTVEGLKSLIDDVVMITKAEKLEDLYVTFEGDNNEKT